MLFELGKGARQIGQPRSTKSASQDLVRRLDSYEVEQPETFERVIEFVQDKMMPIVVRHAVSGIANINSEDLLFEDPAALAMLIDVFSERRFHAAVSCSREEHISLQPLP
jgi:adenylate kinase